MNALESPSTRPYLLRALYEWCSDNGFTPYVAVAVDDSVQVPREYVKDGEIVLNISYDATSALQIGNEFITFKARFAGKPREIMVPVGRVMAIYARENGQGMAFPLLDAPQPATPQPVPNGLGNTTVDETENRVVQLVASDDGGRDAAVSADKPLSDAAPGPEEGQEPPRPGGGGSRPSLKRVK
ncbi:ClpXP protease specificity-enhancing factor [Xylophilus rhododendri]|uniref:ClpXP protease specificity-enhancing factor n=1 Tax=Xylophilus rhododendri TaxID=2697032 RepID=A0A857J567_9BURK|nr:ClpXP protease specificity-enhancing factor [Xylophilus rhododendri]QHI98172.1 ClpXP protease specificity-enhancing factor [Xylophilus rhododendri]